MTDSLVHLPSVSSTNDWLKARGHEGAPHGLAVMAEVQTAGRGRLGRHWLSNPGNLHLSVLLRPQMPFNRAPMLCLAAAVAIVDSCGALTGIKWPNDVLADNGKKVAGVLAEVEGGVPGVDFVVVGIGVNVLQAPDPSTGVLNATSLLDLDGVKRDPAELAARIRQNLLSECEILGGSVKQLLARWRERNVTLGREVRIGDIEGIAEDIDESGALLVRRSDGQIHRVISGDVGFVPSP